MTQEELQEKAEQLQDNVFAASIQIAGAVADLARNDDLNPFVMLLAMLRAAGTFQAVQTWIPLHVAIEGFLIAADADEATINRVKKALMQ
jgi:hypothetical protein